VKVPAEVPAVNMPDGLIVPPPATTDQVALDATERPSKSVPVATNCCVPFTETVCAVGDTLSDASDPGSLTPCTSHAAAKRAVHATARRTGVTRALRATARATRIALTLNIMSDLT
jgi:hypothetical protein